MLSEFTYIFLAKRTQTTEQAVTGATLNRIQAGHMSLISDPHQYLIIVAGGTRPFYMYCHKMFSRMHAKFKTRLEHTEKLLMASQDLR